MSYLDELNPMQREAVLHTEGPLLIFAGAGSGKTRVLTYRIARLIEQGVDPYNIIAITFTNKAAKEMRERVNRIAPSGGNVWVSTFHSTCVRILRREIHRLGFDPGFSIYDSQDSKRIIKRCVTDNKLDEKKYSSRSVANVISSQKNELIGPEEFERKSGGDYRMSNIAEVYSEYQRRLQSSNALDFDDIIFFTVEIFNNSPEVLERYRGRFHYVHVDEYQDTNTAQYRLVSLLSGYADNICVVGDDDQSIYGWRGANIENILRFEQDFPDAKIIKLEQNYRSTKTILGAANAIIKWNENRSDKKLWTENDVGKTIKFYSANEEKDEGSFIVTTVKNEILKGAAYNHFAVLYRNNAQSRAIEDQFVMAGIPYRLYGGVRFYERMEIKDILSYLRVIYNPSDDAAFLRILNVPKRGIGDTTSERIQAYARKTGMPISQAARDVADIPGLKNKIPKITEFIEMLDGFVSLTQTETISELIQKILIETNYLESFDYETEEGENREENVHELISKAADFEAQNENTTLGAFLEEIALVADIDNYEEDADAVALMTLHSAKGLEFDNVFIVGFEENILPSKQSIENEELDDFDAMEEERRLCYVGFTRARKLLYLSYTARRLKFDGFAKFVSTNVSRFYEDIPREFIENITQDRIKRRQESKINFHNPQRERKTSAYLDPLIFESTQKNKTAAAFANPFASEIPKREEQAKYKIGERVRQPNYGSGTIIAIREKSGDQEISVAFEGAGVKKFMASFATLEKVKH